MRLIQRYLFRQLLGHTVLATAALTGVAVLTASLSALDVLVNDRQSPVIFTEITLLATPQIVAMILPLAVCVAGLVGLNRLHTEQEIVICFAGGMSRWRVISPALQLASGVTLHGVTSLADLGRGATMADADAALQAAFVEIFGPVAGAPPLL